MCFATISPSSSRMSKKGVAFKKGHVVTREDIPELLKLGKDHLYVWEKDDSMYHEDEAAAILRDICMGENMRATEPKEGKIELIATCDGLLVIDSEKLQGGQRHRRNDDRFPPWHDSGQSGDKLAGTRVIPLVIKKEKMEWAKQAGGRKADHERRTV